MVEMYWVRISDVLAPACSRRFWSAVRNSVTRRAYWWVFASASLRSYAQRVCVCVCVGERETDRERERERERVSE